jgi:hypothetical protein
MCHRQVEHTPVPRSARRLRVWLALGGNRSFAVVAQPRPAVLPLYIPKHNELTIDNVRYGEVRRALAGAKGRNERTYGLGRAPVVIVHGNQRHELT